ncbi:MAG TPA: helix-turn-helix transcriptional regulator [Burkholderiaceae bacterium]
MPIRIELDVLLAQRKMNSKELADAIGITPVNLSILKTGKARAVRFATLAAICRVLECQPGDILRYEPGVEDGEADDG